MHRSLTRLLSATVLLAFAAGLRAADDPKAVLARAIKAHGGEEALTKLKAGRSKNKGKITLPALGEVEFTQEVAYMLPDKLRDSMALTVAGNAIKVETWVNGDKVAIEANGKDVPVNDAIKKALQSAQHLMRVARLVPVVKEKGFELTSFGEVKVEGKPAVGVRVSAKDRPDVILFFDKKTDLLAKIEFRTTDTMTGAEITEERIITAYRAEKADGIPLPKTIVIKHDGKPYVEAEVVEIKMVEKLDDSEFTK